VYVTDCVLIEMNKWNGDESKRLDEKEIFEDYKYPYKLLTVKELNSKILNEKEPFYYLAYVKVSPLKCINIIDSQTGEIIYSDKSTSYNFKPSDMKDIGKIIGSK